MDKICTYSNLTCPFATLSSATIKCNYQNYCDYQLPRDSRNLNYTTNFDIQKHFTGENNV
jgi:hypothetical protein